MSYADPKLRGEPAVACAAVAARGEALRYVAPELLKDRRLVLLAARRRSAQTEMNKLF